MMKQHILKMRIKARRVLETNMLIMFKNQFLGLRKTKQNTKNKKTLIAAPFIFCGVNVFLS